MKRASLVGALLLGSRALAASYYVDAARPDDSGDGLSWATAKRTVQAALALSAPERVHLKNGTYVLSASINMVSGSQLLGGYEGTTPEPGARSADPALDCILDGNAAVRVMMVTNCDAGTLIDGLTIRKGKLTGAGAGLYFSRSTGMVTRCRILANFASGGSGKGGGAYCEYSSVAFSNNVFTANDGGGYIGAGCDGSAIYATSSSAIQLVNNTVFGNSAGIARGSAICLENATSRATLRNTIIAANGGHGLSQRTRSRPYLTCDLLAACRSCANRNRAVAMPTGYGMETQSCQELNRSSAQRRNGTSA